jgi:hypothetical protein
VAIVGPTIELRIYTNATMPAQGGRLSLAPAEWQTLAATAQGTSVEVTVLGMNTSDPSHVGTSTVSHMTLSNDDVHGALYYWAAASTDGMAPEGIYRHEFGDNTMPAKPFYTLNDGNADFGSGTNHCVACHALSRDGTKMAFTYDGGGGQAAVIDVASKSKMISLTNNMRWNFASMSPDGMRMAVVSAGVLKIIDISGGPMTGMVQQTVMTNGWATHPDWSPDGKKIVYVHPAAQNNDWDFSKGSLVVVTDSGGMFGNPTVILAQTGNDNYYYPSFSPDNQWLLFNYTAAGTYNQGTAELRVVRSDGTGPVMTVATVNATGMLTNSWPRWSPFTQKGPNGGDILYFTFSSKRDYGIEIGTLNPMNGVRPQIWMATFDPAVAAMGGTADPSTAPFWLPFQNARTNNHIAQWAQMIVGIN